MFKPSKTRMALRSTLRLLVFLREAMKKEGAESTPLFTSVNAHAQLIGQILPNKDRVSKEELDLLLKAMELGGGVPDSPKVALAGDGANESIRRAMTNLPEKGGLVILTPGQLKGSKLTPGQLEGRKI